MNSQPPLGIYIHIPFCESKCSYCNFASGVYPDSMILPYLDALRAEIRGAGSICRELGIDRKENLSQALSIRFTLEVGHLPCFLPIGSQESSKLLKEVFVLAGNVEMTLEVNPGTVSPEKVKAHIAMQA